MVRFLSVDWLAQSHQGAVSAERKPHVPCMVQPTYSKSYLQVKTKPSNPEPSPLHPTNCASPSVSELGDYSSGYDSEAASSDNFSVEKDAAQRRVRTKFTPDQISKLEKIFHKHKYLDSGERVKTAQKLNLTETQVRTWFQNRRMKLKREVQDYLAPQIPAVTFQPLPPVPYHLMTGQRPPYPATSRALYSYPVPELLLQPQMFPPPQMPHLIIQHPHFY